MPLHVSIVSVKNYKYIRVYSSYRNEKGQPRSRLIENHGRLDVALLKDQLSDWFSSMSRSITSSSFLCCLFGLEF